MSTPADTRATLLETALFNLQECEACVDRAVVELKPATERGDFTDDEYMAFMGQLKFVYSTLKNVQKVHTTAIEAWGLREDKESK